MAITVTPARSVRGQLQVPGDKSISHRYAILAALANGTSTIHNYAPGADCASTLRCLDALGVGVDVTHDGPDNRPTVVINGRGIGSLHRPTSALDAGNSGTTMRLLTGVLAAQPFDSVVAGDASLSRRPMRRIVDPIQMMGARIDTAEGCPPLSIHGAPLRGIDYELPVASAQVKSAVLLAGLHATGTTRVTEPAQTRDHTERAFPAFGVEIRTQAYQVEVRGGQQPTPVSLQVPGDVSSAAYWAVAAAALPGSSVEIAGVGLNPTRTALLDVLSEAGADVLIEPSETNGDEPVGTVTIRHGELRPVQIGRDRVPLLIDELPVLAALGAHGVAVEVTGAKELRAKESDRIAVLANGFQALGGDVDEAPDGFRVHPGPLRGGTVDAGGDHRMAMTFAIAALGGRGPTTITGHEVVDVSYPGFFETLGAVCQPLTP